MDDANNSRETNKAHECSCFCWFHTEEMYESAHDLQYCNSKVWLGQTQIAQISAVTKNLSRNSLVFVFVVCIPHTICHQSIQKYFILVQMYLLWALCHSMLRKHLSAANVSALMQFLATPKQLGHLRSSPTFWRKYEWFLISRMLISCSYSYSEMYDQNFITLGILGHLRTISYSKTLRKYKPWKFGGRSNNYELFTC